MPKLRTDNAPAFFGEHTWPTTESVVEVAPEVADELLAITDAQFHEVTDETPVTVPASVLTAQVADVEAAPIKGEIHEDVPPVIDASA